jgi:hypothetical protein
MFVFVLALVGCSPADTGSMSRDAFAEAYIEAYCEWSTGCHPDYAMETCLEEYVIEADCSGDWDPAPARTCLDFISGMTCDESVPDAPDDACRVAVSATDCE